MSWLILEPTPKSCTENSGVELLLVFSDFWGFAVRRSGGGHVDVDPRVPAGNCIARRRMSYASVRTKSKRDERTRTGTPRTFEIQSPKLLKEETKIP